MPLGAGERLGPYEIHARIGAGGMGEVYKARDTRLGRDVAIKVSAAEFSERFEREARVIASLNHPNICTLHDVGPNYLVMELVEGPTLAERISDGVVKVLDFGLAKTGGTPTVGSDNSPTLTIAQTEAGVILGTASYMSPEQAKGKPVDKRADIYSYGVVLYEMLAGRRLHRGESITEVLASVIKDEPRWEKIPTQVQPLLRR